MRNILRCYVKDFTTASLEEREKYAELFSEGDENLKELLLTLWGNKIQTYACCAGHDEVVEDGKVQWTTKTSFPYIFFEASTLNESQLRLLYEILILQQRITHNAFFSISADYEIGAPEQIRQGICINLGTGYNTKCLLKVIKTVLDCGKNEENMLIEIKKILVMFNEKTELTKGEKKFIDTLIEFNNINFQEYFQQSKRLGKNRISKLDIICRGTIDDVDIGVIRGVYCCSKVIDGIAYYVESSEILEEYTFQEEKFSRELFEKLRDEIEDAITLNNANTL